MGIVPKDWRTASIVPVFKKGDKSNAANYRPVSLKAICCKIFEKSNNTASICFPSDKIFARS
jgi:hypothetical protein